MKIWLCSAVPSWNHRVEDFDAFYQPYSRPAWWCPFAMKVVTRHRSGIVACNHQGLTPWKNLGLFVVWTHRLSSDMGLPKTLGEYRRQIYSSVETTGKSSAFVVERIAKLMGASDLEKKKKEKKEEKNWRRCPFYRPYAVGCLRRVCVNTCLLRQLHCPESILFRLLHAELN